MKKIISQILFAAVAIIMFPGCKKMIDNAYKNPNADVRVPVEQLLPGIIASMAANASGHGPLNDIRFAGKYVQNFFNSASGGQYDQMGGTIGSSDNAASMWRIHYYDIGQNCLQMIKWGTEEKKWDYVGVGKAIFAWSWLQLTDYHGEIIQREAFNTSQLTFRYDSQAVVYDYVRQLSYEALSFLNKTGDAASQANLALGDQYFYNGDVEKWKKFVYGILARSYNHLTNKSTYKPDSVIYYCNLSINSIGDNASVKFGYSGGTSGSANFYGPLRGNLANAGIGAETALRQSAFIANLESGLNSRFPGVMDPRAWYILRPNTNGTFKGLQPNKGEAIIAPNDRPESFYGVSQAAAVVNTVPGTDGNCRYLFRNTSDIPVLTSSEIAFMKAEAAYLKGDKATALTAYIKGISDNFDMLSTVYATNVPTANLITPSSKTAYLTNTVIVPASAAGLTLSHIMLQKYIALYVHGVMETWVDMRRYHYTDLDRSTSTQVYADFTLPSGADLFTTNNGKPVYRVRPRYNSEYVWNFNELVRIGADQPDYNTKEQWFSMP